MWPGSECLLVMVVGLVKIHGGVVKFDFGCGGGSRDIEISCHIAATIFGDILTESGIAFLMSTNPA